jgi:ribosomal protein S18 acetylase RimI-like enzyme
MHLLAGCTGVIYMPIRSTVLIDTNVLIPLEIASPDSPEEHASGARDMARRISEAGCSIWIHEAALDDIKRDSDLVRRDLRLLQVEKYPLIHCLPEHWPDIQQVFGKPQPRSNEWVDYQMVLALASNAADLLVTQDRRLHRRAAQAGLGARVLTVPEALEWITSETDTAPSPPPAVISMQAYQLNPRDPIFEGLRADYPGFDQWLAKCRRERRQTWLINGPDSLAAVCIVKTEELRPDKKTLKICTFEVSPQFTGRRYGELLLKTLFEYSFKNGFHDAYLTVFEKHVELIALLEQFGFVLADEATDLGELVLRKRLTVDDGDAGTHWVRTVGVPAYVVPIQPTFHAMLFPEAQRQQQAFTELFPCGNGIRKAYVSNAGIRRVRPGANLLFYRSKDLSAVTCLGVVEETLVSRNAESIARFANRVTVYSLAHLNAMAGLREVLAIRFRQARVFETPIRLQDLIAQGVLKGPPQSIAEVSQEGVEWLASRPAV